MLAAIFVIISIQTTQPIKPNMKLLISKTTDPKNCIILKNAKRIEFTKNYIQINFASEKATKEAYEAIWEGPESFKDLAHNASAYPFGKTVGFTQFFDYTFAFC